MIERRLEGPGPKFQVYWNAPTFMCHRYGLDFSAVQSRWGIVQNSKDQFRGEHIVILYDPGDFPAILREKQGREKLRNGGVPQEGSLETHINKLRAQVDEMIPDRNFQGLGVIDFEAWRPIWRQNWASLLPYRDYSRQLERKRHPFWSSSAADKEATRRFQKAAHEFLLTTIELLKQMRPHGKWGYYTFPYCFNYTPKNMQPTCPAEVRHENDEIQWLFDASDALFPSLYLSKHHMTAEQHIQFEIGRMNEAVRVAQNVPRLSKPSVNAYVWYKYHDADEFLSKEDLYNSLNTARQYHAGGVVIWGSAKDTNSEERCKALENYLNTVLGPTVKELQDKHYDDSPEEHPENSGGFGSFFRHLVEQIIGLPGE